MRTKQQQQHCRTPPISFIPLAHRFQHVLEGAARLQLPAAAASAGRSLIGSTLAVFSAAREEVLPRKGRHRPPREASRGSPLVVLRVLVAARHPDQKVVDLLSDCRFAFEGATPADVHLRLGFLADGCSADCRLHNCPFPWGLRLPCAVIIISFVMRDRGLLKRLLVRQLHATAAAALIALRVAMGHVALIGSHGRVPRDGHQQLRRGARLVPREHAEALFQL